MTKYIFYCSIMAALLLSCKKYEGDKKYSTYTAWGRLSQQGNWRITEVIDLSSGQTNVIDSGLVIKYFSFWEEKIGYSFVNANNYYSISRYSNILKPAFINSMFDTTDLILIGVNGIGSNNQPFEFTSNGNKLKMTKFISFGSQDLDVEFDIERLELGNLQLNYQNKFKIILKKVPE